MPPPAKQILKSLLLKPHIFKPKGDRPPPHPSPVQEDGKMIRHWPGQCTLHHPAKVALLVLRHQKTINSWHSLVVQTSTPGKWPPLKGEVPQLQLINHLRESSHHNHKNSYLNMSFGTIMTSIHILDPTKPYPNFLGLATQVPFYH